MICVRVYMDCMLLFALLSQCMDEIYVMDTLFGYLVEPMTGAKYARDDQNRVKLYGHQIAASTKHNMVRLFRICIQE